MNFRSVIATIIFVGLLVTPSCRAEATILEIQPLNVLQGEDVQLEINAAANQQLDLSINYQGDLAPSQGVYSISFKKMDLSSNQNSFEVKLRNVENLNLSIKYGPITYIKKIEAINGEATLCRNNIPEGSYDIKVWGNAQPETKLIHISFKVDLTVETDDQGEYFYRVNTDQVPPGTITIKAGGETKTVQLILESPSTNPTKPFIPPPPSTADIIKGLEPGLAAGLLKDLGDDELSSLLELEPGAAAEILLLLSPKKQEAFIKMSEPENVTRILQEASVNQIVDLLENLDNETSGSLLSVFELDTATEILFQVEEYHGASMISAVTRMNVSNAAIQVEQLVKDRANETDPEEYFEKSNQIKEIITLMEPDIRLQLLQGIAALPHTPSTVAEILMILDPDTSIEIIDAWLNHGETESLSLVLGFLTDECLAVIVEQVDAQKIYPVLTEDQLRRLPDAPSILLEASLSPKSPESGEEITLTIDFENTGKRQGHRNIAITIDGDLIHDELVLLGPGETKQIQTIFTIDEVGEYTLQIGDYASVFNVKYPPTGANITVSWISYSPEKPSLGEEVNVTIILENTGETAGSIILEIKLDETVLVTREVSVGPLERIETYYGLTIETPGTQTIWVNEYSMTFAVDSKRFLIPGATLIHILLALIGALYLRWRRLRE